MNDWLIDNKLSLHLGKTESILFGSKRKLAKHSELNIKCGNSQKMPKSEIKYLTYISHLMGKLLLIKLSKKQTLDSNFYKEKGGI